MAKKLYSKLQPAVSSTITSIKGTGQYIADGHNIIGTFKRLYPADYNYGLSEFSGREKLFHAYLSRMLLAQKFGTVTLLSDVNSLNCKGYISGNSEWRLH